MSCAFYYVGKQKIPTQWSLLGMEEAMSYDEWILFLKAHGFKVRKTTKAMVKTDIDRSVFTAQLSAQSKDHKLYISLDFNYGNKNGEGYFSNSKNSLYMIYMATLSN